MSVTGRIYLDNAATSWPKPDTVYQAMDRYNREIGAPVGRSSYREADEVQRTVEKCRTQIAQLIRAASADRIIFTYSGTDSLNLAIQGLLRPNDHVVTTQLEHNSVLRPLRYLQEHCQVDVTRVAADRQGQISAKQVIAAIRPETRLVIVNHVSNVIGSIQPVAEIGKACRDRNCLYLVDAAQSLGHLPVDVQEFQCDLLAAPGHKGLCGPTGTGLLYVRSDLEHELKPLRFGGTGTISETDQQPSTMPDRFESGNHNAVGLFGLAAGVRHVTELGISHIQAHVVQLGSHMQQRLETLSQVTTYGCAQDWVRTGVVSLNVAGYDARELAALLDSAARIQTRAGFHCAPGAHQAIDTDQMGGTLRLSWSEFNSTEDLDRVLEIFEQIG